MLHAIGTNEKRVEYYQYPRKFDYQDACVSAILDYFQVFYSLKSLSQDCQTGGLSLGDGERDSGLE